MKQLNFKQLKCLLGCICCPDLGISQSLIFDVEKSHEKKAQKNKAF